MTGAGMMRREDYHHTPDQVETALEEALRIVSELEISDDLRPVAFAKAVDLLAAKQIFYEQPAMGAYNLGQLGRH